ncbi:MAG: replication protein C, IncQ-type [Actinomycetota bacterium]|nr:replication protein C, IncQ-type [Actinomycetota bacterium]
MTDTTSTHRLAADRPGLIRLPQALAAADEYHQIRILALDTIVALSAIAGDSRRVDRAPDGSTGHVFGELGHPVADGDPTLVDWEPLLIATTPSELGRIVGRDRDREAWRREILALCATDDPQGAPLVVVRRRRSDGAWLLTLSSWWNTAARGDALPKGVVQVKGKCKVPFTYVRPTDYSRLRTPAARRMYVWLAGWLGISGGAARPIGIDTLASHLWLMPPSTATARRDRRRTTRGAIAEIAHLPDIAWQLNVKGGMLTIRRRTKPRPVTGDGARSEPASAPVAFTVPTARQVAHVAAPTEHREPYEHAESAVKPREPVVLASGDEVEF